MNRATALQQQIHGKPPGHDQIPKPEADQLRQADEELLLQAGMKSVISPG